ncbi:Ligand-binding SRPBCC domain-containing protein [Nannocystis exedens]|uniref:Ligand-binding SRPBCC domain-containing protein n=1 Tax=Nannocystis exedens TaxID=54 RepID=A0A1I2GIL9_9BACT|nr:SRPBCC family protein [Nannocystis exedens]PCC73603.1 cell division protein [Nannocystis exedens]SFF17734.1 Ligand-binding SRPBCC domain-containing protein [Nannocystis exedens]
MPIIELVTSIGAPLERCFDLARSVDVHLAGAAETGERAVAGVVRGLLGPGDEVTWRARHFGVTQLLTSKITLFERPRRFRDSMVRGAFARFDHDHFFEADGEGTIMRDRFDFTSPLGPLGRLADALVLTRYMRNFLVERNRVLREVAESDRWGEILLKG